MDNEALKGQSGKSDQGSNSPKEGSDTPKPDLEKLLAEWKSDPKGTESGKEGKKPSAKESELAERLERLESAHTRTSYESTMKGIVAQVKGDLDVDDWIVESWVNRKADNDPRLVELWEERDTKKAQFQEVIKALGPEFQEYAKTRIIPKADDKNKGEKGDDDKSGKGLAAAVRNSREASPSSGFESVNWAGLSDNDLALKRAEVFRLAKAGKLK